MTAVYPYQTGVTPPAPFVAVTLAHPESGQRVDAVPAQVDTGAFKTVVPGQVIRSLNLVRLREIEAEGLHGTAVTLATFIVTLTVQGTDGSHTIEVLASDEEPFVLLGRDVLNHFRVVLDGPGQRLEIA